VLDCTRVSDGGITFQLDAGMVGFGLIDIMVLANTSVRAAPGSDVKIVIWKRKYEYTSYSVTADHKHVLTAIVDALNTYFILMLLAHELYRERVES
jgi:hypothetical protein